MTQNQLIELFESDQTKALVERSEERGFIEPAEFEAFVLEHDPKHDAPTSRWIIEATMN